MCSLAKMVPRKLLNLDSLKLKVELGLFSWRWWQITFLGWLLHVCRESWKNIKDTNASSKMHPWLSMFNFASICLASFLSNEAIWTCSWGLQRSWEANSLILKASLWWNLIWCSWSNWSEWNIIAGKTLYSFYFYFSANWSPPKILNLCREVVQPIAKVKMQLQNWYYNHLTNHI